MDPEGTFERIMRETEAPVRAYIAGLGTPIDLVDDLAQDVYIEFYKGMAAMPDDASPVRWLKGIAHNLCMNHFRRSKRERERRLAAFGEIMARHEAEAEAQPTDERAEEALRGCLLKLTERQRLLIRLRYEEGLSADQMAERTQSQAGTVRVTLFRLYGILRKCVSRSLQELRA